MGQSMTDVQGHVIGKAWKDRRFKQQLLADPTTTINAELERQGLPAVPEGVKIRVVEESPDTVYLVLPYHWSTAEQGNGAARTVRGLQAMPDPMGQEPEPDTEPPLCRETQPPTCPDTENDPVCTHDPTVCPPKCCLSSHTYTGCQLDAGLPEDSVLQQSELLLGELAD